MATWNDYPATRQAPRRRPVPLPRRARRAPGELLARHPGRHVRTRSLPWT